MEAIATWLKNPYDYKRGVELLWQAQQSTGMVNHSLIFMLETGESSFNKKKLIDALRQALDNQAEDRQAHFWKSGISEQESRKTEQIFRVSKPVKKATQVEPGIVNVPVDQITQTASSFDSKLKGYYQLQSDRHSRLKLLHQLGHPQKELQALCFEILDIGKKIRAIQLLQQEWRRTGEMPVAMKTVRELDPASQFRRLTNNRSYISKFDGIADKQDEVDKRIQENYELEEILR